MIKMPDLESPEKYAGLYVFEYDGQVAVGYTAEEIAVLVESERYAEGKVYRIHRAMPDGTLELAGVARERFLLEDGMLFFRACSEAARKDFQDLTALADEAPPPCRMKAHLARIEGAPHSELTAIIFPAEYAHEVGAWLNRIGFAGGDFVAGGPSQVTDYYASGAAILARRQLRSMAGVSRPAEEVLATTGRAIQRVPA